MAKRSGRKSAAQTPALPSERIKGSKKNPKGSAASEKSASQITLSATIIKSLKGKLDEFKKSHPSKKGITLNDLKAVYRRGAGAYSKSHRPTITGGVPNTRNAWSMARVNAFLRKAGGGESKEAYVQDDDLMENGGQVGSFLSWFNNWYKGIKDEMNIMISVPNEISGLKLIPIKEKNVVILDLFEKIDQSIDAKPYLRELLNKADEYSITIYLFPEPRYKYIKDIEHRNKITRDYIIKYYRSFGFELTANKEFMKRLPTDGSNTDIIYKAGGEVDEHKETYKKWKSLVNMSRSELQSFYDSEEGKKAGLSSAEAKKQGIDSGRESARWIMKMKDTPVSKWTPAMWKWAKKQISFISRMSGNKGGLYEDNGNKTRKHTSLLIWGHNPEKSSSMKYAKGGKVVGYEVEYQKLVDGEYESDIKSFKDKESAESFAKENYGYVDEVYEGQYKMARGGAFGEIEFDKEFTNQQIWDFTEEYGKSVYSINGKIVSDKNKGWSDTDYSPREFFDLLNNSGLLVNFIDKKPIKYYKVGMPSNPSVSFNIADYSNFTKSDFLKSIKNAYDKKAIDYYDYITFESLIKNNYFKILPIADFIKKKYENGGKIGVTYFIGRPEVDIAGRFGKKRATWKTCVVDDNGNKNYSSYSINIIGSAKNVKLDGIQITQKEFDKLTFDKKYENGGQMDVRIEDTVQRMDDPHFADISYYKNGGALTESKTLEQVAKKHGMSTGELEYALNQGIAIEMEHTKDRKVAKKIALDHLYESPVYYTYLIEMEDTIKKDMQKKKSFDYLNEAYEIPKERLEEEYQRGIIHESQYGNPYDSICQMVTIKMMTEPNYYTELEKDEMEKEGDKLEGYYEKGGDLGESCQIFTPSGERAIDPKSIESLTKCVQDLPQTKTMHYDFENHTYTPERIKLHKEIIKEFKENVYCISDKKQPIAILMGGSPASGKSTFVKKFAPYLLTNNLLKIDADEIRSKLPEYRGFNATQTHLETKDIVNTLLSDRNIGIPCKFDLLYDGTMNNTKSYTPLINLLKHLGYKVFIIYIDKVNEEVIKDRALKRYQKSGRFVPVEVIDDFFEKGTAALEQLKKEVDGYIVVDGSTPDYKLIARGGKEIPKFREYEKIGEPINIENEDIIQEFAKGGDIQPDNKVLKDAVVHNAGSVGGMLVGKRHSEGGIKALNKSTGQPLEMEGGEVVITRNAVSDGKKRMFDGKMMTNREILSRINESGGGVSFAEGGDVPEKCSCKGHSYKWGGKLIKDFDIVNSINDDYLEGVERVADTHNDTFSLNADSDSGFMILHKKYVPSFYKWKEKGYKGDVATLLKGYKDYLYDTFEIIYDKLPMKIQMGLIINHRRNLDKV